MICVTKAAFNKKLYGPRKTPDLGSILREAVVEYLGRGAKNFLIFCPDQMSLRKPMTVQVLPYLGMTYQKFNGRRKKGKLTVCTPEALCKR